MPSVTNINSIGPQGPEGKSAYQVWLEEGNIGTEQDFFTSLSASTTFETVSKNLASYPYTLNYTGEDLTSIVYNTGVGQITKTFSYTLEDLTTITLSGDTPLGIDLIKTFVYNSENLTNITYS